MGQPTLRADLRPQVALAYFLKRYGAGPRRNRMTPLYEAMHAEAERLIAPLVLHAEYSQAEAAGLLPWLTPETQAVVLGVATLGAGVDARIAELTPVNLTEAYLLEEITTRQITALVNLAHGDIRAEAAQRGLLAGPAFRPGLGRWPMEAQRILFDHLPASQIQVALNEALLMTPIKTTSFIIPLRHGL